MTKISSLLYLAAIALVLINVGSIDAVFDLVLLKDPSALCLDGTPGAYYISRQGDPKKIYLEFEGGGWCGEKDLPTTLQSCYQRSKTDLGSSAKYPQTRILNQGVLSLNQNNNFKNWTRVLLMYCDGAGHQGTSSSPTPYKDSKLYFRGNNITVQQLNTLDRNNKLFSGATQIVVGGDSAGGLATYLWTNYVVDKAKNAKVWSLPDSGIFLDSINKNTKLPSYKIGFQNVMKLSNVEIDPPVPECVQKFKDSRQNCMFAQNIYMHIRAPTFHIQSLYDTWSVPNILGVGCISGGSLNGCSQTDRSYIQQYHKNVTNLLFLMGSRPQNGFWAPVCANHVYARGDSYFSPNFRIPMNSIFSVSESVRRWMTQSDQNHKHIDMEEWPLNKPCSGLSTLFNIRRDKQNKQKFDQFWLLK